MVTRSTCPEGMVAAAVLGYFVGSWSNGQACLVIFVVVLLIVHCLA